MRIQLAAAATTLLGSGALALASSLPSSVPVPASIPDEVPVDQFVNFETPHVHPISMTPDGNTLLAVNTADNRLEVFNLASGLPNPSFSVSVGLDPVAVRARTNTEAWVVNQISDSVSVVDLATMNVVRTIQTLDEPADVVFAGTPTLAYVTCSQANVVQVFETTTGAHITNVDIFGEDPREMAVSPDGQTVYAAIFESGNNTTVIGGGLAVSQTLSFPPNVASDPAGPHGGVNPPPNDGANFSPTLNGSNPTAPRVALILKKDAAGSWIDDTGADWTSLVSGPQASLSGRVVGWDLADNDVAMIDTSSFSVSYQNNLMNACMALGVNPASGDVTVVGTEATNEIRFEPNVNGRFVRVNGATFTPGAGAASIGDLNQHLTYTPGPTITPISQPNRNKSIGDPRAIAWLADGSKAFVAGMGSNNVIVVDQSLARVGINDTIEVGQGPTGIAIDEARGFLYVMNKFDASISVVNLATETTLTTVPLFDPTPAQIIAGRPLLYDTHLTSALGQASCASCHIDARTDRLGWDLGDPAGDMKPFDQNCLDANCQDWHPMKGPMTTQTLRDIIGKEPHHWRADRFGIEDFTGAFHSVLGDDIEPNPAQMQDFEDFLATIHFPPNPFRNFDNSLPTNLPLDGHFTTGRFAPAGNPLPNGNAVTGLNNYRFGDLDGLECVTCHTLPTGMGTNGELVGLNFIPLPPGPMGELHHLTVSVDGTTNISIKVPQLRSTYEKTGFNTTQQLNTAGFGVLHDGSVDSIERFLAEPAFSFANLQELSDMTAFMLAFGGSDLPSGTTFLEPPGSASQDAHAAVGKQVTLPTSDPLMIARLAEMFALAEGGEIGLIAKGIFAGESRGFTHIGLAEYQSDRSTQLVTHAQLTNAAGTGTEITFTAVPVGTQTRIGVDRDLDGFLDQDELDSCANPADETSTPANSSCCVADVNGDGMLSPTDFTAWINAFNNALPECDQNGDGNCTPTDFTAWIANFNAGCP
jgi:YVTN family beta-propeller protein